MMIRSMGSSMERNCLSLTMDCLHDCMMGIDCCILSWLRLELQMHQVFDKNSRMEMSTMKEKNRMMEYKVVSMEMPKMLVLPKHMKTEKTVMTMMKVQSIPKNNSKESKTMVSKMKNCFHKKESILSMEQSVLRGMMVSMAKNRMQAKIESISVPMIQTMIQSMIPKNKSLMENKMLEQHKKMPSKKILEELLDSKDIPKSSCCILTMVLMMLMMMMMMLTKMKDKLRVQSKIVVLLNEVRRLLEVCMMVGYFRKIVQIHWMMQNKQVACIPDLETSMRKSHRHHCFHSLAEVV